MCINDMWNLLLKRALVENGGTKECANLKLNEMYVVSCFSQDISTGREIPSISFNMTSRQCVENIKEVVSLHSNGLVLMLDGTCRLFSLGWVLFIVGATVVNMDETVTFRPFMTQVTRTEDEVACASILEAFNRQISLKQPCDEYKVGSRVYRTKNHVRRDTTLTTQGFPRTRVNRRQLYNSIQDKVHLLMDRIGLIIFGDKILTTEAISRQGWRELISYFGRLQRAQSESSS